MFICSIHHHRLTPGRMAMGAQPPPPLGSVKFMVSTGAERPLEKFKPPPPRQISEYSPFHHACHLFSQFNIAQTIMSGTAMKRALYRFLQYTFWTLQKFSPAKCFKFLFFIQYSEFSAVLELIVKIMFCFTKFCAHCLKPNRILYFLCFLGLTSKPASLLYVYSWI